MVDVSKMTVKQAQEHLFNLRTEVVKVDDAVQQARKRIHEFAPSTREYDLAEVSLSIAEINDEFFLACSKAHEPSGIAARHNVTPETIEQWGGLAKRDENEPTWLRLVVERDGNVVSYAMPFKPDKRTHAEDIWGRFRDTLVRKNWLVTLCGVATAREDGDVVIAEA